MQDYDIYERFKRAVDTYIESQGLSIFLNSKDRLLRLYMIDTPKEQIIKDLKQIIIVKGINDTGCVIDKLIENKKIK